MKSKRTTEDYLKTIYVLSHRGEVRCCQLAKRLSVSRPTVSVTIQGLIQAGFVYMDERKKVHLTKQGLEIAQAVAVKCQVLCELLVSLGVDEEIASEDACKLEHAVGDISFQALKALVE